MPPPMAGAFFFAYQFQKSPLFNRNKMPHKKSDNPNRLIHSTSPYLLQHAYNPVDWYEWGDEALAKAKREDKPILLSIGYSSCHWCHVMAHQSFEDSHIAQLMNEHFICVKLDREERPDIDQVYMEAVQAMNQNGGWPLNVFLTPNQQPFFGGTYFPPKNWAQLLIQINQAFQQKRKEIEESASELSKHIGVSDLQRFQKKGENVVTRAMADKMFATLDSRFDFTWGGIDKAPKFIMPSTWLFLMRYYQLTKETKALEMLHLTLKKIAQGGIYDQIGGGFARYSVDGEWFAPHFEKMLYDNAQLLSLYSEAYQLTKDETYKDIVYKTVEWLEREMTSAEGGFYSALDADSEGEEGKFYTWTYEQLKEALGNDLTFVLDYYQATEAGNWEHGQNILIRNDDLASKEIESRIIEINKKLLTFREKRERPGLDDKILTSWNAMTIQGLTDAYKAFADDHLLQLAEKAVGFIESKLLVENKIYRSYKDKHSTTTGFLDDYGFLIAAYTSLYQVTFNEKYIHEAKKWCEITNKEFFDEAEGFFHYSGNSSESLIARKKEVFDNVIPSSNAVMARNLHHLGIILDKENWKEMSKGMLTRFVHLIESEPVYMSYWGILAIEMIKGIAEIVVVGKEAEQMRKELHRNYLPFGITMGTSTKSDLPLITSRERDENTIYVCFEKTCQLPVHSIEATLNQIYNT